MNDDQPGQVMPGVHREVAVSEERLISWLAYLAAVQNGAVLPPDGDESQLPAIGYFWHPGIPGGPAETEQLVGQAVIAEVLAVPPGVKVGLEHRPGRQAGDSGTYRVLAQVQVPGRDVPLTLATDPRQWCYIGGADSMGSPAAESILREVAGAASSLLAALPAARAAGPRLAS